MPKHDPFSHAPRARPASRIPRLVGAIALALLAAQLRRSSAAPEPSRRPRPGRPGGGGFRGPLRRGDGGHPMPEPVQPDRPLPLQGGAAAELSFDD